MVFGEQGLYDELKAVGAKVFWAEEGGPAEVVAVGLDRKCTYAMLEAAHRAILGGAKFIASNRDNTYPVEGGTTPGAGVVVAALETSTGVKARLIGKPSLEPVQKLLEMAGVAPERVLVVGDRADTDVRIGLRAGLWTVLVLTGVTSDEQARCLAPDCRPHRVITTLEELPGLLGGS
jgi:ribonucleotide monophosphatase NagD (HAD superfamily)